MKNPDTQHHVREEHSSSMTVSDCQVKQVQTNHLRFESLIRKNDNSNCPLEPKQSSDSFSNFEQAIETSNVRDSQRNLCDRQILLLLVESPIPVRSVCTSLRRPVLSKGPSVQAMNLMLLLAASGRQLPVRSDCQYSSTSGLASVATRPQLAGIVFLSFQRMKKNGSRQLRRSENKGCHSIQSIIEGRKR